ncbi:tetratricopeptide repeat protein [Neolewinella persica]|uniref:tetratricopeptide repeat protein n=1 Tax=Neolewinella persica TaxID=70998 RepID=UPI00037FA2F2|nr:tetratricopeptide repeat protein [Neolewinella persica]
MRITTIYLFISLIIACTWTWSCQNKTDLTAPVLTQKEEVDSLIKYAIDLRASSPDSTVTLCDRIIQSSKEIDYPEGEIKGFFNKAAAYFLLSKDGLAEDNCQIVLEKLKILSPVDSSFYHKLTGSTYILQGILERRKGDYANTLTLELKALVHFERIKDSINIATSYANISESFRFIKNFEQALLYSEKAEDLMVKAGRSEGIPGILLNRGNLFFDQEQYTLALEFYETAQDKAKEAGDYRTIITAINNIGASHERLGSFEIGLNYYLRALEMYQEEKDNWGEANTLANISMVYFTMGQFERAEDLASQALKISKEHSFLETEQFSTENLSEIFESKGEYSRSLALRKQAQVLQDSLYNQQKFETVNRLEKQFNEEKSKRVIAQKDKALLETELQTLRLRNIAITLGVFFLIVLLSAWVFYQRARFRKEKNRQLLLKNTIIQDQNEDLELLVNAYESQREKSITLGNHNILLEQIIYIRYQNRISYIFLKDQTIIEQRGQLSQLMAELSYKSHFHFSQINQNYIVHFKNVEVEYNDDAEDRYYFTTYLPNDQDEYRDEEVIKTRKRSGITKNFEREYQRYIRLNNILT